MSCVLVQVIDGMLLEGEGTVTIIVESTNSPPRLACGVSPPGLMFSSQQLLSDLRGLSSVGVSATIDRQKVVQALVAERNSAIASTSGRSTLKTQALTTLAGIASDGMVIAGSRSHSIACSSVTTWDVGMSTDASPSYLNVSLLAFDPDGKLISYQIVTPPSRGTLYATTALPGRLLPLETDRAYLDIDNNLYEVGHLISIA